MSTSQLEERRSGLAPRVLVAAPPEAAGTPWRSALAGPAVALIALAAAAIATRSAGVPIRDPGGVTVRRLATAVVVLLVLVAVDILVRAVRRAGARGLSARVLFECVRARWTRERIALVALAIACFHITYLAYRNVKSVAPLLRPGDLFDDPLLAVDRRLFGGEDPAALLHGLLGTGAAAHALSAVYMAFFFLIPVSLAAGLVFLPDVRAGLHIATALSLTWLLGAGSYLLLPSIGPFHWDPGDVRGPPGDLGPGAPGLADRPAGDVPRDPSAPGAAQGVGAFASLHTAICCTALVGAHVLRVPRVLIALLWADHAGNGHRDRLLRLALPPRRRRRRRRRAAGPGGRAPARRVPSFREDRGMSAIDERAAGRFTWRALAGAPLVAAGTVVAALIACDEAGVAFRDPDNVAAQYVVMVGAGVALLVLLDVYLRAAAGPGRAGRRAPP